MRDRGSLDSFVNDGFITDSVRRFHPRGLDDHQGF
jgi:hypothetical protein